MELINIRFGDFCFDINPSEVKVEYETADGEDLYIGNGAELINGGMHLKKVKGKGVFFGENAEENYEELESLFMASKVRMLILPSTKPFNALFTFLKQTYPEGSEHIGYEFVFTEQRVTNGENPKMIYAQEDESLWDISYRFGIDMDELLKLNLHVENINFLKENEVVYLC